MIRAYWENPYIPIRLSAPVFNVILYLLNTKVYIIILLQFMIKKNN